MIGLSQITLRSKQMGKTTNEKIEIVSDKLTILYQAGDLDEEPRKKNEGLKRNNKNIPRLREEYLGLENVEPVKEYLSMSRICDEEFKKQYFNLRI